MDFGIDKLIEMFEARFGKRAATALLFVVGLGAGALAIHAIFTYLLIPSWQAAVAITHYAKGAPLGVPTSLLFIGVTQTLWGSVCGLVGVIFVRRALLPKYRELEAYLDELQGDVNAGVASIRKALEQAREAGIDTSKIELPPYRRPKGQLGEHPEVLKRLDLRGKNY